MSQESAQAVLNDAFVGVYRSYGQYLGQAGPTFDVGEESIRQIIGTELALAETLGRHIVETYGSVQTGTFPTDLGHVDYLNSSRLVIDWLVAQQSLLDDLRSSRQTLGEADPQGGAILDEIIAHEADSLAKLKDISSGTADASP